MVLDELKSQGIHDVPGGFVLTGGTASLPGILELAQEVFQSRVRSAVPDYIGVREPQYTAGVGLIKYAYKNAKLQGRKVSAVQEPVSIAEARAQEAAPSEKQKPEKKQEQKLSSKMKKFFGYFFEE